MGYEIEMSFDLKRDKNVHKLIDTTIDRAFENNCERHYKFSEMQGNPRKLKRQALICVFYFPEEYFDNMADFLKTTVDKYKKKIHIESIYQIDTHNLIYASPYYMNIMETHQKDDYKNRRQNRSFSDTDYYILRDILKKNY
jgi:hypothetical protein